VNIFSPSIRAKLTILSNLTSADFKRRYFGTYFGAFWAFAAPVATISVLLFVFNVGFKSGPVSGVHFDLWLVTGLVVWFYFSDSVSSACNSIVEYSFLIKKIQFTHELLPLVKVGSALYVHFAGLGILLCLCFYRGVYPSIYWLQIPYYLFALICLVTGLGLIGAVIQVFFKDFQGMVTILMQIGLWATPILWEAQILPAKYLPMVQYNPVHYIVQGYRDSLLFNQWFFTKPIPTLQFWLITAILLAIGIYLFSKTKRDFVDVL
jgi:ABC-type polysaccharide/polyol phosphate export permease